MYRKTENSSEKPLTYRDPAPEKYMVQNIVNSKYNTHTTRNGMAVRVA